MRLCFLLILSTLFFVTGTPIVYSNPIESTEEFYGASEKSVTESETFSIDHGKKPGSVDILI
jgi:hypothetical protein